MMALFLNPGIYGVQLTSDQLSGDKVISHHVIREGFAPYSKMIEESAAWKEHNTYKYVPFGGRYIYTKGTVWVGASPNIDTSNSHLHDYLWGHSVRKGILGKLAALVYKIQQVFKGICSKSDEQKALDEIERYLSQAHKLSPDKPVEDAKAVLQAMLVRYNSYA